MDRKINRIVPKVVSLKGVQQSGAPGLLGVPKEIPGIIRYNPPNWGMAGSGTKRFPRRLPKQGEAITVNTDVGSIRVRIAKIQASRAMIGSVEILNSSSPNGVEINGIRHKDTVIVRGMDFVTLVHTD
jgi:hypothetical protein